MNGVSSFLDGSEVYGDSITKVNFLRTFSNGKVGIEKCSK